MRHLREGDFKELRELISEAADMAKMERANFDDIGPDSTELNAIGPGETPTHFIRRKTKCWRESWLVAPLERAVEILEEKARRD